MQQAIVLDWNSPFSSKTDGNTVQYACIDPQLTGKCIKYHNDQWFSFKVYEEWAFINISNQNCRDLYGVQLVVFEGDLCSPDTYQVHNCVSLATQDDIYISLIGLNPSKSYWLNVDGYLHDYCQFDIEVSDEPKGVSAETVTFLEETNISASENRIKLDWLIPDSLASKLLKFKIFRRGSKQFKFQEIDSVDLAFNAFGEFREDYSYHDTLYKPDTYHYRLVGEDHESQLYLLKEFSYEVAPNILNTITLSLDYENNTPLNIIVKDADSGLRLDLFEISYSIRRHYDFSIYVDKYQDRGVKEILVEVVNQENSHLKEYYFELR